MPRPFDCTRLTSLINTTIEDRCVVPESDLLAAGTALGNACAKSACETELHAKVAPSVCAGFFDARASCEVSRVQTPVSWQ